MNSNDINIRKMTSKDYGIMARWLSTTEVLEFYGDIHSPFTIEDVRIKYGPRIRGERLVSPFIAELDNSPIGYMQHYQLLAGDQKEFGYIENQIVYGIDQFIGHPQLFSKGYGTMMVSKFIDFIINTTDAEMIVVDPEISNKRAIRCYEKCGFTTVKKINNNNNLLMEFKVTS